MLVSHSHDRYGLQEVRAKLRYQIARTLLICSEDILILQRLGEIGLHTDQPRQVKLHEDPALQVQLVDRGEVLFALLVVLYEEVRGLVFVEVDENLFADLGGTPNPTALFAELLQWNGVVSKVG